MLKETYIIEEVSTKDIIILKKSGIKFTLSRNPYDHTKNAEFDTESDMNKALELLLNY